MKMKWSLWQMHTHSQFWGDSALSKCKFENKTISWNKRNMFLLSIFRIRMTIGRKEKTKPSFKLHCISRSIEKVLNNFLFNDVDMNIANLNCKNNKWKSINKPLWHGIFNIQWQRLPWKGKTIPTKIPSYQNIDKIMEFIHLLIISRRQPPTSICATTYNCARGIAHRSSINVNEILRTNYSNLRKIFIFMMLTRFTTFAIYEYILYVGSNWRTMRRIKRSENID